MEWVYKELITTLYLTMKQRHDDMLHKIKDITLNHSTDEKLEMLDYKYNEQIKRYRK